MKCPVCKRNASTYEVAMHWYWDKVDRTLFESEVERIGCNDCGMLFTNAPKIDGAEHVGDNNDLYFSEYRGAS